MSNTPIAIFWFRRDLRLGDNAGLFYALKSGFKVLPLFIFDTEILDKLENKRDLRVLFIHNEVVRLSKELKELGCTLVVKKGSPLQVWKDLLAEYDIHKVFTNHDFDPYARKRDKAVEELLAKQYITFDTYKDHVIFEKDEVVKDDGTPYTVFTPYSKKWHAKLKPFYYKSYPVEKYTGNFLKHKSLPVPSLKDIGFEETEFEFPERVVKASIVSKYNETRDYPAVNGTSHMGIHLRFGTISIRKLLAYSLTKNAVYINELVWRDFYQQILCHFPKVEKHAFKRDYDNIEWVNNEVHFACWCEGKTGIPLVDAGMRELNETGYMHNRVRMVVASFLTKNLLIDWRWGEAYFAEKLLDFDLAANNGGWQWAAGCGTDAAPYFRIFNPITQATRFDPQLQYIKKWVPEYGTPAYPQPIVDLAQSRDRCLKVYQKALKTKDL